MDQLPKEVYYVVGFLLLSNIKSIFSFFRDMAKKDVEHEFNMANIAQVQITLGQILERLGKLQIDVGAAHEKLRILGGEIDNFKRVTE